ncbi:MAG: OmpH family outer membrane protein [Bacteroidales bacterium]|nr:OmpH family outer membrane protein [Candidatus Scybalocola fimicaballi]
MKHLLTTLSLLLTFAFASAQNTHVKLAHYDEAEVIKMMKETETAERTLKSLSDQYEAEMVKMEGEYTRKAAEYQKEQSTWDETIKRVRMEEIHTIKLKMQNYYDMASKTLADKRNELYAPIYKKIEQAVAEVAKEQGFLYVWDVKDLKYHSPQAVDITGMIKRKLGIK